MIYPGILFMKHHSIKIGSALCSSQWKEKKKCIQLVHVIELFYSKWKKEKKSVFSVLKYVDSLPQGKPRNTGVGSLSSPTQKSNGVSCIAVGFFTNWAIREAHSFIILLISVKLHSPFLFSFLQLESYLFYLAQAPGNIRKCSPFFCFFEEFEKHRCYFLECLVELSVGAAVLTDLH